MATGIRTGSRTAVRRPALARVQKALQWAQQHRRILCVLLALLILGPGLAWSFEASRDPLERSLAGALDHTLRGADYRLSVSYARSGPVLLRRPPVLVVVNVFQGQPAQLEAARQVVAGLTDPGRDRVEVLATPFPPARSLWYWWCVLAAWWSLVAFVIMARKQRWLPRWRKWRDRRRPAPPPPQRPVEVPDGRLAIDVGPGVDLSQLAVSLERVRAKLLEETGVRLPAVRLRQHPDRESSFWDIWLRDRLMHRYDPGPSRAVEPFLSRLYRESAWELASTQDIDELAGPVYAEHSHLRGRVCPIELTLVSRGLLQRGLGLKPFEPILVSLVRQRELHRGVSLEDLTEAVVGDLQGGGR